MCRKIYSVNISTLIYIYIIIDSFTCKMNLNFTLPYMLPKTIESNRRAKIALNYGRLLSGHPIIAIYLNK